MVYAAIVSRYSLLRVFIPYDIVEREIEIVRLGAHIYERDRLLRFAALIASHSVVFHTRPKTSREEISVRRTYKFTCLHTAENEIALYLAHDRNLRRRDWRR